MIRRRGADHGAHRNLVRYRRIITVVPCISHRSVRIRHCLGMAAQQNVLPPAAEKQLEELTEADGPIVIAACVARALGLASGEGVRPKDVLAQAAGLMPGVDFGSGPPKVQLLFAARVLAGRRADVYETASGASGDSFESAEEESDLDLKFEPALATLTPKSIRNLEVDTPVVQLAEDVGPGVSGQQLRSAMEPELEPELELETEPEMEPQMEPEPEPKPEPEPEPQT